MRDQEMATYLLVGAGKTPLTYPLPPSRCLTPTNNNDYGDNVGGSKIYRRDRSLLGR